MFTSQASSQTGKTKFAGNIDSNEWIKEHFAKGKLPPFSFVYAGKKANTFIKQWEYSSQKQVCNDPNVDKYIFSYKDLESGLVVKCFVTGYKDFSAVEWILKFSNTSTQSTPVLEEAEVISHRFTSNEKGKFILHHANGSNAERSDFMPLDEPLEIGENIKMNPQGGRSSNSTAFPFFNIESPGQQGVMVAVGWSGNWYADVQQTDYNTVSLKAGMEGMKLTLYPEEEIRTPRVCLLFWKDEDRMAGHNQFRQFILAYHTRKINDKPAELPLSAFLARGGPSPCNEHICSTETYAIAMAYRHQQFNIVPEVLWIDAGWYTGCEEDRTWYTHVGNWTIDEARFPNGLRPVSDAIHAVGAKFILWFEPERVYEGSKIFKEHPEWLLKLPESKNFLFNLGNKDARLWLTDYISDFFVKEGVDYYRQDFNMNPMGYWKANDKPDREGISEIRHIEGLYAFWDSLLVRFPNLIIDNCASGGRRIDLETVSRSSPLWRTDYQYGESNGYQCHTYGLNFYLPLHGTCNKVNSPYGFRSSMSSAMALMWDINSSDISILQMQKCILDFKRLRPYYYGDYYPLTSTENITLDNVWLAYQLNRSQKGDGIIMAFRWQDCLEESIQVKMRGLDPNANYELLDDDSGTKVAKTGSELMTGFELSIQEKLGSLLISYKQVDN